MRLATLLCLLACLGMSPSLAHEGHDHERDDFSSDAGFVIGTYVPEFDMHTPLQMAEAATVFLDQLNAAQKKLVAHDLQSPERQEWTNTPARGDVGGLALEQLDRMQLHAFCDLLARVMSRQGYEKVVGIMLGDDLRAFVNGKRNRGVGIGSFRLVLFGSPSADQPWGLQLDGHHLALNVSIEGDQLTMSPSFFGTRPEVFQIGASKTQPMQGEVEDAYAFLDSLNEQQREGAVVGGKRGKIKTGPGADGTVPEALGLSCGELTADQRAKFTRLVANWINSLPPGHAKARIAEIQRDLGSTRFAWYGGTSRGSDISYAIVGPTIIIEFACQDLGGNPLDHLHSMYRNPENEYGKQIDL